MFFGFFCSLLLFFNQRSNAYTYVHTLYMEYFLIDSVIISNVSHMHALCCYLLCVSSCSSILHLFPGIQDMGHHGTATNAIVTCAILSEDILTVASACSRQEEKECQGRIGDPRWDGQKVYMQYSMEKVCECGRNLFALLNASSLHFQWSLVIFLRIL